VTQVSAVTPDRKWLAALALALAVICVVTFATALSITGPFPKSVAYGHNPLFEAYSESSLISGATAPAALVIALVALRSARRALLIAIVCAVIGTLIFIVVTSIAAHLIGPFEPSPLVGKGDAAASFPVLVLSPPMVGMAGVVIGVIALLALLRGVSGLRSAMAALILGGVVTAYWLLDLVLLAAGGE
jgi:hypothetical protein